VSQNQCGAAAMDFVVEFDPIAIDFWHLGWSGGFLAERVNRPILTRSIRRCEMPRGQRRKTPDGAVRVESSGGLACGGFLDGILDPRSIAAAANR
jgi:hypothetical protein